MAVGVTERSRSDTLYNTVVYIGATGEIVGRHRKLVPTGAERLVWANGNDHLLTVIDVGGVKVGSLICWENYMPLARMAMYERGIDVLLAPTWDNSDEWVPTLRHIAKEGQIFVVGVTAFLRGSDVPRDLSDADELYGGEDDLMSRGNTSIVAPGGELIAGPLIGEAGVVSAELDLSRIAAGRRMFDPTGHYARPDVLSLRRGDRGLISGDQGAVSRRMIRRSPRWRGRVRSAVMNSRITGCEGSRSARCSRRRAAPVVSSGRTLRG